MKNQNQDKQYWTYAPGRNAEHWDKDFQNGVMSMGWLSHQSLNDFQTKEAIEKAIIDDPRYKAKLSLKTGKPIEEA